MSREKLKYYSRIKELSNCPSDDYKPISGLFFRWVQANPTNNDFIPASEIKTPPQRVLDDSDKLCMSYGLSFFDSCCNALLKYSKEYFRLREHQKADFIKQKGTKIATVEIDLQDGIANSPVKANYGHFTFHENENVELCNKIVDLTNIYEDSGLFVIHYKH